MKLLGWMQRKFCQNSGDPFDADYDKSPICNCLNVRPLPGDRRHHISRAVPEPEKALPQMLDATEEPVHFDGLLSIGTFGSPILWEATMEEEEKSGAVEEIAEKEVEETTEKDLMVVMAELQKVLEAEAGKENGVDRLSSVSARSSHGGAGRKRSDACPLQGFLFGSPVDVAETSVVADRRYERRASLGELFMRSRAAELAVNGGGKVEDSVLKDGGGMKTAAGMKGMAAKSMLKGRSLDGCAGDDKCPAAETNLQKILRIFHRKIHPENDNISSKKQHKKPTKIENLRKFHIDGNGSSSSKQVATTTNKNLADKIEGLSTSSFKCISCPQSTALERSSSDGKREQWIKTDADYLVLEL